MGSEVRVPENPGVMLGRSGLHCTGDSRYWRCQEHGMYNQNELQPWDEAVTGKNLCVLTKGVEIG